MPRPKYLLNKIVADRVFADMMEKGQEVEHLTLKGVELTIALGEKVVEEADELAYETQDPLKEAAQLQLVTEALLTQLGFTREDLDLKVEELRAQGMTYTEGHYVETVRPVDGDGWDEYFAKDPKRYPIV